MSSVSSQDVSKLKRKRDPPTDSSSSSEPEQTEDVPLLSHAAKRKQRKSSLKKAVPTTESPARNLIETKGDASLPPKRENSIWVGNLCYKTTPESLRRFFDGVGEVTRVHLPTKLGKTSTGDTPRRENRGCGSVASYLWYSFAYLLAEQLRLCGFRDARGQECCYPDVRIASGRTPPFNQGWCVHLTHSCIDMTLNPRGQAAILRVVL